MFGRKKTDKPLVAGRDRAVNGGATAPVYSYYASRSSSSGVSKGQAYAPTDRSVASNERRRGFRIGGHSIVVAICVIVGLVCAVKLVVITADAKVIPVDATASTITQQRTTAYTKAADALLRSSVLNGNKLTLDSNGIESAMLKQFPELTSVVVTAPLVGNRPVVYVSPAKPAFNLQTPQGLYSMDAHGFVLAKLDAPEAKLTLLKETSSRTPVPGKQYLATSIVSFCNTLVYELQKAGGKTVQYIDLPAVQPYQVDVYLTDGSYRIKYNLQEDPLQQSGAAIATLQKLGEGGGAPREYLDVRVPGRVYYK